MQRASSSGAPRFRPDLLIETDEGEPFAVVEIKGRFPLDTEWQTSQLASYASSTRDNGAPHFLLLTPERAAFWESASQLVEGIQSADTVDLQRALLPFLGDSLASASRRASSALEIACVAWLTAAGRIGVDSGDTELTEWFERTGLLEQLRHGNLVIQP